MTNHRLIMENWRRFLKEEKEVQEEGLGTSALFALGLMVGNAFGQPDDVVIQAPNINKQSLENRAEYIEQGSSNHLTKIVTEIVSQEIGGKTVTIDSLNQFLKNDGINMMDLFGLGSTGEIAKEINSNIVKTNWIKIKKQGGFVYRGEITIVNNTGDDQISKTFEFNNDNAETVIKKATLEVIKKADQKGFLKNNDKTSEPKLTPI